MTISTERLAIQKFLVITYKDEKIEMGFFAKTPNGPVFVPEDKQFNIDQSSGVCFDGAVSYDITCNDGEVIGVVTYY